MATKLVKIFLAQGLAVPFLDYLIARELARTSKCWGLAAPSPKPPFGRQSGATKEDTGLSCCLPADPNTLFRSNSLASKSVEMFMKVSKGGDMGTWARRRGQLGDKEGDSCPTRWWGCPTCTRS